MTTLSSTIQSITYGDFDVDGDGSVDEVRVEVSGDLRDGSDDNTVKIFVNGQLANSITEFFYGARVKMFSLANGLCFIYVNPYFENDDGDDFLLAWGNGSLTQVYNFDELTSELAASHIYVNDITASGDEMVVTQGFMSHSAGGVGGQFTYAYDNGRVMRASDIGDWASYSGDVGPALLHASRAVTLYADEECTQQLAVAPEGTELTSLRMYVNGPTCSIEVETSSGERGWVELPNELIPKETPTFKELHLAG